MTPWLEMLLAIFVSVMASSGFWAFLQKRGEKKNVNTKMLKGLGHDRIVYLGMHYIERGWLTQDEYENLHDYLWIPYSEMGGNGSAARVMKEVDKLPIRKTGYHIKEDVEHVTNEQSV